MKKQKTHLYRGHAMKKTRLCLLILVCCIAMLGSCSEESNEYTISEFDNESKIVLGESSGGTESGSETQVTGEFTVKEKKYTFEGTDLMLLEITNEADKNCSVTVNGAYLDKDGTVLKTETQTFDQFAAGYQNYFLFQPEITFEKFEYTIEVAETEATMYAPKLKASLSDIYEMKAPQIGQGDYSLYPTIVAYFEYEKETTETLDINSKWILFGENDQIIAIVPVGTFLWEKLEGQQYPLYYTKEETLVWPEEYRGNIRAIHVLNSIKIGEIPQ